MHATNLYLVRNMLNTEIDIAVTMYREQF